MPDFIPSAATRALGEDLAKERKAVADLFTAHKNEDGSYGKAGESADWVGEAQRMNDAIGEKAEKYEAAVNLEKAAYDNDLALKGLNGIRPFMNPEGPTGLADGPVAKSRTFAQIMGEKSAELKALAEWKSPGIVQFDVSAAELKTLSSSDIAPQADRQAVVPSAQFLGDVTPLFVPGTTDRDQVEFELESTFTNNAAETAEGSSPTESVLSFTLTQFPVRELSTFLSATRRSLEDNAGLQSYISGRLGHMLDLRRSQQLLVGNGTTPNLKGILNISGIQTQAKGSDPTPDAIYKAMVLVRSTGDAEPTGVVFHALDWQDVKLLRTIDGVYIWGSPTDMGPDRIWGNTVAVSNSITQNTALVGAFRPYAQVFNRDPITIEVSTEHSTFFTDRKAAILIYQRIALAVYRPAAFCQVTGV